MLAYRIARTGSFIVNSNNAGSVRRWALSSKLQSTTGATIIDSSPHQQIIRYFETSSCGQDIEKQQKPGSLAFAECESQAISDLFHHFVQIDGGTDSKGPFLCVRGVRELLASIGERPDEITLRRIFKEADLNGDGKLHLDQFLIGSDKILGGAPARIVIVVGGPGSGKGLLCKRLAAECGVIHLSSGTLLRNEVARDTPLGREVADIMKRGELVSSAVITALVRRHTRSFPGKRVLLDGFPRSLENAHEFVKISGKPELALHLDCDDTVLMERIINRSKSAGSEERSDDNFETALTRLRTYHKYHHPTIEWLREQHVPIVNLDCSGTPENVWQQLLAIGRLMRPAAQVRTENTKESTGLFEDEPISLNG